MKKLRRITAAEATPTEDKIKESLSDLDDAFSYVIAGLEHLSKSGAEAQQQALVLIEQIQAGLDEFTQRIADAIIE